MTTLDYFSPMRNLQVFSIFVLKGLLISMLFSSKIFANTLEGYSKLRLKIQNTTLNIYLAKTPLQHKNGLSNVKRDELERNSGMLFQGQEDRVRQFWMYHTFFPLDIIFLDEKFKIVYIEKKIPNSPPNSNQKVPEARPTYCRHVLEIPSDLDLAKFLTIGMELKFY